MRCISGSSTKSGSPIKVSGELQLVQSMVLCGNSVMCVRELTERFDSETAPQSPFVKSSFRRTIGPIKKTATLTTFASQSPIPWLNSSPSKLKTSLIAWFVEYPGAKRSVNNLHSLCNFLFSRPCCPRAHISLYPRGIGANGAGFGRDRVAWATGAQHSCAQKRFRLCVNVSAGCPSRAVAL